jgi:hypothetical protein
MITLNLEEYEAELLRKSINLSLDTHKNEDTEEVCKDCDSLEKILGRL